MFHDASGIIFELLRAYPRCCRGCHRSATRVARPLSIVIGEHPLFCDHCETPKDWPVDDLPQAEVVRAANTYLDTHPMKTSGSPVVEDEGKPITFIVKKGEREVARTTKLDDFLAACEAAAGGK